MSFSKTALVSISFRKLSCEEIIDLVCRSGLDGIEWGGDVHVPCGDIARATCVGNMTRAKGLSVTCYGSYVRMTDEERKQGTLDKAVQTAKALGAPLIRVWAGKKGSHDASAADREEVVRNTLYMAGLAEKEKLQIAFEYHGGTLTDDRNSALGLLQAVRLRNVGCLWQPPVDMSVEDCLQSITTVRDYIRNIHVFSWSHTERLPLEAGIEKWQKLLASLSRLGGEHALEIEFVQGDDPEQLPRDAECLRRWLNKL